MTNTALGRDAKKVRGNGVATLGGTVALLATTAVPNAKSLEQVVAWGLPDIAARAVLYAAPVVVVVAAMLVGRAVGSERSTGFRWILYGILGAVAGFFLAMCLDLFAALPPLIEGIVGPLVEPSMLGVLLWALGAFGIVMGAMMTAISILGRPGLTAFQIEDVDPECLDVRNAERAVFAWNAVGLLALGVACSALAVAQQADADARLAPVLVALIAGAASALANYVLWRGFDELQRRQVVNGYATSAVVVTLGAFAWGALQSIGVLPAFDAIGAFLALIFIQVVSMLVVTAALMGGKPMLAASA